MKTRILAQFLIIVTTAVCAAAQTGLSAANQPSSNPKSVTPDPGNVTRERVRGQNPANDAGLTGASSLAQTKLDGDQKKGRRSRSVTSGEEKPLTVPTSMKSGSNHAQPSTSRNLPLTSNNATTPTASQIYRVGIRDVLDIQLGNNSSRQSTLFTVREGGMLEYPFAGNPINVAGMTTTEIASALRSRIKLFDNPKVTVTVRDYASHLVNISGFVAAPGLKSLRREAMPLYALLAEALVLPEASRATITRAGREPISVDLKDANLSATLVVSGDIIKVFGPAVSSDFFFIGGHINAPGQKSFHAGLTLTQAILASGGTTAAAGSKVKVSRQGSDGRLVSEVFNLRRIQEGKLADPRLQKGDRIEVTATH